MSWLRVEAAADHAGVSQSTIRRWVRVGLPQYKIGGTLLLDSAELDDWIRGYRREKFIRRHIVNNPNLRHLLRKCS